MHISPNTLSKKLKLEFGKPPSQLIQERVILEAKKLIHLTRKSIKEIASELNFEDEFYFSKYFKKTQRRFANAVSRGSGNFGGSGFINE